MEDFLDRAGPWFVTLALHNWPVLLSAVLVSWAALRVYACPTRRRVLLLYGLFILVLAFEYQKHGLTYVRGTTGYLFSAEANPALRRLSQLTLLEALPVALYLLGLAFLVLSALPARQVGPRGGDVPRA